VYTHSASETAHAHEVLEVVRPLHRRQDEYVLLVAFSSWHHFDGWFGDAGALEVWIGASDLEARAFNQAWCMVRTD
jgi:hypothetical protein